jgi:hypothetical protein
MKESQLVFNPPPGWPQPPPGWTPPMGWTPAPDWPDPPDGWQLWLVPEAGSAFSESTSPSSAAAESQSVQPPSDDVSRRASILEAENVALRAQLAEFAASADVVVLDDDQILQEVGIYRYHHPLENAAAYKDRLTQLNIQIKDLVRGSDAIEMSNMFTFDNSLAKGRKMTRDLGKLMLRAYNAEVDNSLRSLRAGNVATAKKRIDASRAAIKKLGQMMDMHISDAYHSLRMEEVELTADFLMKKQEEREAAREERARIREEKKVQAELAAQREQLDKERNHLLNAIEALQSSGESDPQLEAKLAEIDDAIAQNDYRAANIRAGYVYVISNRGVFGPNIVKIGLTRRLEPRERIRELGGASVPFRFDVHGLFFSEDAVALEAELHRHFATRRVNHANSRKEFFFASPLEVRDVLVSKLGNLLEFNEHAESTEYLQSIRYWPDEHRTAL